MNKIIYNVIAILVIIFSVTSFNLNSYVNIHPKNPVKSENILCRALKKPNRLLLNRAERVNLRMFCSAGINEPLPSPLSVRYTACYYRIPRDWAQSIYFNDRYNSLEKMGLMIKGPQGLTCPNLTYRDFERLTFTGKLDLQSRIWTTLQTNEKNRMLRKKVTTELLQPTHLTPLPYTVSVYPFRGMRINLLD